MSLTIIEIKFNFKGVMTWHVIRLRHVVFKLSTQNLPRAETCVYYGKFPIHVLQKTARKIWLYFYG